MFNIPFVFSFVSFYFPCDVFVLFVQWIFISKFQTIIILDCMYIPLVYRLYNIFFFSLLFLLLLLLIFLLLLVELIASGDVFALCQCTFMCNLVSEYLAIERNKCRWFCRTLFIVCHLWVCNSCFDCWLSTAIPIGAVAVAVAIAFFILFVDCSCHCHRRRCRCRCLRSPRRRMRFKTWAMIWLNLEICTDLPF